MPIQRDTILSHALNQLEIQGLSASTENLLHEIESDFSTIRQFWYPTMKRLFMIAYAIMVSKLKCGSAKHS